jgi:hypothetical protein
LNQNELQELCGQWQKILGLSDWVVSVRLARFHELSELQRGGEVTFCLPKLTAEIAVLDSADYDPKWVSGQDQEKTVVHELLHLQLAHLSDSDKDDIHLEQTIELLSRAFVALKRGQM